MNKFNRSRYMKGNERGRNTRQYSVDSKAFGNITSESQAYWLGFIAADGYVITEPNYRFGVTLAIKDLSHIKSLKRFLKARHPIKYPISHKNKGNNRYCSLVISSKDLTNNLIGLGIVPRKTFLLKFPAFISADLIRHYIRGYFDGDGWVSTHTRTGLQFGIMGRKTVLRAMQSILMNKCGVRRIALHKDKRHPNSDTFSLVYGGSPQAERIYHYLYDNSKICLPRKKKIFDDFLKNYISTENKFAKAKLHAHRLLLSGLSLSKTSKTLGIGFSTVWQWHSKGLLTEAQSIL